MNKRKVFIIITVSVMILIIAFVYLSETNENKYLEEFKTGKYMKENSIDTIRVNYN